MKQLFWPTAFAALALVSSAAAQTWEKQSPSPTAWHLTGVSFVSPSLGFVSGERETLLRTLDGGLSWQNVSPVAENSDPFYGVHFRDAQNGWIWGNNNNAWRTSNGGTSWTQMSSLGFGSWRALDFVSANTAFMGANGAISRTTDGGATWQSRSASQSTPIVYCMDFVDANVGLVGGTRIQPDDQGIYRTTDAGANWTRVYGDSANDIVWLDSTTAIATVGSTIVRSLNSGVTWTVISAGITTGLLQMTRVDANTLAGVSAKGDIWRSTDLGLSWTQVFDGLGDLPVEWSIQFSDAQHGWVTGQTGFVIKTEDGGLTWSQVSNGTGKQVYKISMFDNQRGLAAAENGYIFRTTDGGKKWNVLKVEVTGQVFLRDESLKSVCTVGSNFAAVAGPGGTVFKSLDGGQTWQNIGYPKLPSDYFIDDVKFITPSEGWITGIDFTLNHDAKTYHTTDGGENWTEVEPTGAAIEFVDTTHGWIAAAGIVYRTVNGGQTWQSVPLPSYYTSPQIDEIKFLDANTGWVAGWDGLVAKTTDGGQTWTYQNLPQQVNLFSIAAISSQELYMSGRDNMFRSVMFHTTNGGSTWQQVASPNPDWFVGMTTSPDGSAYGVGARGLIYKLARQSANLSGAVTLQDFVGSVPGTTVSIEIHQAGSSAIAETLSATLGAGGTFTAPTTLSPGSYDIYIKASHWLRRKLAGVQVTTAGATGLTVSLVNGDVTNDNAVSLADFSAIRTAFGSSAGGPQWNAMADLNGDGTVSLADFSIVRARFGSSGE